MTLFIDASALIAIIAEEPEQETLALSINRDAVTLWSAMVAWEAVSGLCRSYKMSFKAAQEQVEQSALVMPFRIVPIGEQERVAAFDAYRRYGKGSGHPARLNMGDCFAYACAKTNAARLLYKGDDFARTDLA